MTERIHFFRFVAKTTILVTSHAVLQGESQKTPGEILQTIVKIEENEIKKGRYLENIVSFSQDIVGQIFRSCLFLAS